MPRRKRNPIGLIDFAGLAAIFVDHPVLSVFGAIGAYYYFQQRATAKDDAAATPAPNPAGALATTAANTTIVSPKLGTDPATQAAHPDRIY